MMNGRAQRWRRARLTNFEWCINVEHYIGPLTDGNEEYEYVEVRGHAVPAGCLVRS